jgi:hypothetical protein
MDKNLDIHTEKGQKTLEQEDRAYSIFISRYPSYNIVETDKDKDAKVDSFLVDNDEIEAVVECKCRTMTYEKLQNFGSWLITYDKIECGKEVSELLRVPYLGFLYLVPDDVLLIWEITNSSGSYKFSFDKKKTKTQYSVNGGTARRLNAFLPNDEISKKLS